MSIEYLVDVQRNLVDTKVLGHLDFDETVAHLMRLARDPQVHAGFVEIVDFDGITDLEFPVETIRQVPERLKALARVKEPAGIVFYTSSQLTFGFARQLQTLHDLAKLEGVLVVVETRDDALAEAARRLA
jgi:hypothetical protein